MECRELGPSAFSDRQEACSGTNVLRVSSPRGCAAGGFSASPRPHLRNAHIFRKLLASGGGPTKSTQGALSWVHTYVLVLGQRGQGKQDSGQQPGMKEDRHTGLAVRIQDGLAPAARPPSVPLSCSGVGRGMCAFPALPHLR